jgi:hypothetical protein
MALMQMIASESDDEGKFEDDLTISLKKDF